MPVLVPGSRLPPELGLLLRSRAYMLWAASLAALTAALCFVPLFDVLGYELAFALALVVSFAAAHLGAMLVGRARAAAQTGRLQAERPNVGRLFASAALGGGSLLVLPLALSSANALRVRNCDFASGLLFFALLPLLSSTVASAWGVIVGLLLPRRRLSQAAALLGVAGSLLLGLLRFYRQPPIFVYEPFAGYFPGALYDENVSISSTLLAFRVCNLAWVAAGLLLCALLCDSWDRPSLARFVARWRRRPAAGERAAGALMPMASRFPVATVFFLALALTIAIALGAAAPGLGFRISVADLERALGGRRETAHFVIIYDLHSAELRREIDLLARDHEFRHAQLCDTLGVQPAGKITSYVFSSAEQKQRLVGAKDVLFAKPWQRTIFLQHEPFPQRALRHELAHVFAGQAAAGSPFRLSARLRFFGPLPYPVFAVGLIEGVAEAADFHGDPLTAHQWSRAMVELGLAPPLGSLFGLGFFGSAAARGYTIAGSFCRFLRDTYGPGKLLEVYASAGDFRRVYGRELASLEADWRRFLQTVPLRPEDREVAAERFRRRSIFHRPCAHAIAAAREAVAEALADGEHQRAIVLLARVCADDPEEPGHLLALAHAELAAGKLDQAAATATRLLGQPQLSPPLRATALELIGQVRYRQRRLADAEQAFAAALALPVEAERRRLLGLELLLCRDPALRPWLGLYLIGSEQGSERAADDTDSGRESQRDQALAMLWLKNLDAAVPGRCLAPYLIGRRLYHLGRFREALPYLEAAIGLPMPVDRGLGSELGGELRRESLRLIGLAAYRAGNRGRSRQAWQALVVDGAASEGMRLEAQDFVQRIAHDEGSDGVSFTLRPLTFDLRRCAHPIPRSLPDAARENPLRSFRSIPAER